MTASSLLKIAVLGLFAINLSACSSSSWLTGINVTTASQNNDQMIQLSADLNTGSISLAGLTLPINSKSGVEIGSVSLVTPASGSGTELALDFDLTTALGLSDISHDATLPNGTAIPISNIDTTKLMTFDVGNAGSKAYVLYDSATHQAVIGIALVINGISSGVTANLLLPFTVGSLSGSVGPFSGAAASQSGIALFVNASSVLSSTTTSTTTATTASVATLKAKLATLMTASTSTTTTKAVIFKVSSSAKTLEQKKIESHLAQLNAKAAKLQAQ